MKMVTCPPPCGHVMQAESDEEVLEMTVAHARSVHPEMAEGKSDDELKEMARPMIMEA